MERVVEVVLRPIDVTTEVLTGDQLVNTHHHVVLVVDHGPLRRHVGHFGLYQLPILGTLIADMFEPLVVTILFSFQLVSLFPWHSLPFVVELVWSTGEVHELVEILLSLTVVLVCEVGVEIVNIDHLVVHVLLFLALVR